MIQSSTAHNAFFSHGINQATSRHDELFPLPPAQGTPKRWERGTTKTICNLACDRFTSPVCHVFGKRSGRLQSVAGLLAALNRWSRQSALNHHDGGGTLKKSSSGQQTFLRQNMRSRTRHWLICNEETISADQPSLHSRSWLGIEIQIDALPQQMHRKYAAVPPWNSQRWQTGDIDKLMHVKLLYDTWAWPWNNICHDKHRCN